MNRLLKILTIVIPMFAFAGCATTANTAGNAAVAVPAIAAMAVPAMGEKIDGNWGGTLTFKDSPFNDSPSGEVGFRLAIENSELKVFVQNTISKVWTEAMPGQFRIASQGSNAVVQAAHSGKDGDGTWVETWVFVLTCQSKDKLRVEWVRLVNNVDLPSSNPDKTFSYGAAGILTRSKDS